MPKSGQSRRDAMRDMRQAELRDYIREQRHEQEAVGIIQKLQDLGGENDEGNQSLDANQINRLRIALEGRFKMMNKYISDLKSIDISGDVTHHEETHEEWLARHSSEPPTTESPSSRNDVH